MADPLPLGLLAQFPGPERLVDAARIARAEGARGVDAFTPFPVDELNDVLDIHERSIARLGFYGGVFGLVAAYAMQIGTNLDYPLDIGGRPLIALQAFALIGFELTVLFAVLFMVIGFFILNRLPHYHQPLFWVDRFEHATRDGFFLFLATGDEDAFQEGHHLLASLAPLSIDEVPR